MGDITGATSIFYTVYAITTQRSWESESFKHHNTRIGVFADPLTCPYEILYEFCSCLFQIRRYDTSVQLLSQVSGMSLSVHSAMLVCMHSGGDTENLSKNTVVKKKSFNLSQAISKSNLFTLMFHLSWDSVSQHKYWIDLFTAHVIEKLSAQFG